MICYTRNIKLYITPSNTIHFSPPQYIFCYLNTIGTIIPPPTHDVRVRNSKHIGLDYLGGEPDVKLQETTQSAMILLFTLFQVDILIPHLANDSSSRLLFRKTLTSCSCGSIGATPLMGH